MICPEDWDATMKGKMSNSIGLLNVQDIPVAPFLGCHYMAFTGKDFQIVEHNEEQMGAGTP